MMHLLTPEQHAQVVDALDNGLPEVRADALAMLKAMKPASPVAYIVDGGKKNQALLYTFEYELELVVPKIMCKPLYAKERQ